LAFAAAAGTPIPAMSMRPDTKPLLEKAETAAADYAGTDDAAPFLVFLVQNGAGTPTASTALDTLTLKHLEHAAVAQVASLFGQLEYIAPGNASVLLERAAKSTNADVRGWALFGMHKQAIEKADRDGDGYKTAKMELQKAIGLAKDDQLKAEVQGAIDLREKLGAGNVAPDIEGTDLEGVAFKLSDYRGKVVFLDFWGDW
jgi:hypothetical protein